MLQFRGLSVCHIRARCAQMAGDIDTFLLLITAPCLSQITSKFGLHRSTPSSPKFAQNDPPSYEFDLSARDIRWQIVVKWLEIVQWSYRTPRTPPWLFWMVPSLTHYTTSSSPKMGSKMHTTGPTSRHVLPPGKYDRRHQKAVCPCWMSLCAERYRLMPSWSLSLQVQNPIFKVGGLINWLSRV